MAQFTLYSRSYCHLCDDMLHQLRNFLSDDSALIDVIDIDADDALVLRFDELVPVLFGQKNGQDAQQICHYFLDVDKLKDFLNAQ
jgi:hypothetical protein|nr:glutaredoxin family protein [uncultured Undibacterium sp.]